MPKPKSGSQTRCGWGSTCACLVLALAGAAGELHADDPAEAPVLPPYRYLFLIDVSENMSRVQEVAADTASRLVMGGFNGRARIGEQIGFWTIGKQLETNALPATMWVPQSAIELGNRVYRSIRDQKLAKGGADIALALRAIRIAELHSGALTVFLISSGSDPVIGTPFDLSINPLFQVHGKKMRKAGNPFVTVFVIDQGRMFAHAVSPGGQAIYIPPSPSKPPPPSPPAPVTTPAPRVRAPIIHTNEPPRQ